MIDVAQEVLAAEARIRPHIRETPVEASPTLSEASGAEVFLKLENFQLTGSFKLRGAMSKLLALSPEQRKRGVVAASSGNFGAAVAHGVQVLGVPGIVFVPGDASPAKVAAIRSRGIEVRRIDGDCVLSEARARDHAAEYGLAYLSPYNDPQVVGGQGTVGLELARQLEGVDAVYVALGGGGLIAGIAGHLKSLAAGRNVEIVACSPENSRVMHESVAAGRILELDSLPTLSDGTAGGVEQGAITFELCQQLVDRYLAVSEDAIRDAMLRIIGHHHVLIEGAAGVAVAGFLQDVAADRERLAGRRVAIVLCGSNIALETLKGLL